MMVRFTKKVAAATFLTLFLAAAVVSCGKKASTETSETPADSTEHPSDSSAHEHPADSAGQEHPHEHPSDSTAQ